MDIHQLFLGQSRSGWAFEDLPPKQDLEPYSDHSTWPTGDEPLPDFIPRIGKKNDASRLTQNLAASPAMTANLVNPLLRSVRDAFAMVLDCGVSKESVDRRRHFAEMLAVTARIGLTGPANGAVAVSFAEATAIRAAERMLDKRLGRMSTEVLDALAELTNIIVGSAKSRLEMGLDMSLPSVTVDEIRGLAFPEEMAPMRMHCCSDIGDFCIDFGFIRREEIVPPRGTGVSIYG